ncbi:hypothetical protein [Sphingomicrobium aestuariivivum]|uniref:hypothetical protein n=1 Tax=Sphingomicrobium aestuariivivum TaxID=1582356 RepID=UPI001FD6D169|nr:hypothetical protein [Sphingomicrobium aestuariivivum]MCJ8191955.1 hypothetical protein [Sphingomicrobium aestuariivivum]
MTYSKNVRLASHAVAQFLASYLSTTKAETLELDYALGAVKFPDLKLLAAQLRWSSPVSPPDMLSLAEGQRCDVILARDMHDRDPMRAIRWDIGMWIDGALWVFQGCRLSLGFDGRPRFLGHDQNMCVELGPLGLRPAVVPIAFPAEQGIIAGTQRLLAFAAGVN